MKTQTVEDMLKHGATEQEVKAALAMFTLLQPGLKVKRNGRIDTAGGDKTVLGLFRTIKMVYFNNL
mgnify:CR=1 FL=1